MKLVLIFFIFGTSNLYGVFRLLNELEFGIIKTEFNVDKDKQNNFLFIASHMAKIKNINKIYVTFIITNYDESKKKLSWWSRNYSCDIQDLTVENFETLKKEMKFNIKETLWYYTTKDWCSGCMIL